MRKILGFLLALVKPLAPARFCAACGRDVEGEAIVFDGRAYCETLCVPTIWREAVRA